MFILCVHAPFASACFMFYVTLDVRDFNEEGGRCAVATKKRDACRMTTPTTTCLMEFDWLENACTKQHDGLPSEQNRANSSRRKQLRCVEQSSSRDGGTMCFFVCARRFFLSSSSVCVILLLLLLLRRGRLTRRLWHSSCAQLSTDVCICMSCIRASAQREHPSESKYNTTYILYTAGYTGKYARLPDCPHFNLLQCERPDASNARVTLCVGQSRMFHLNNKFTHKKEQLNCFRFYAPDIHIQIRRHLRKFYCIE